MDRLKQREALLASFISLDYENDKQISREVFHSFMSIVYLHKKRYVKRINKLFGMLDTNDSG